MDVADLCRALLGALSFQLPDFLLQPQNLMVIGTDVVLPIGEFSLKLIDLVLEPKDLAFKPLLFRLKLSVFAFKLRYAEVIHLHRPLYHESIDVPLLNDEPWLNELPLLKVLIDPLPLPTFR